MDDYYARLAKLAAQLEKAGLATFASELRDAVGGSSTASEALSESTAVLQRILVRSELDPETRRQARAADDHGQALWKARWPGW
jgi:hypothetical protein